ncbi:ABC transporter permease [Dictyobacter arantiisoli]|uniref:ABC transporter permease n=1 Tax=Dictyobacter arantiisoli TaxID=2014874 RepID=A0A5A5TL63_9CHLR|nr:ABC-2 family transporter protein [Dictyobacter arantiisoli]GCF12008.1 ABC transporter permease [Dictyobacter arantiisoli]
MNILNILWTGLQRLYDDLDLYRRLISIQIKAQTQYKTNLLLDILTYLGVTTLEFMALLLYFIPFPTLLGWHIGEVALLAALMSISFGCSEMIGAGIDNFSFLIIRGEFDRMLLRPTGPFLQVIGSDFRLRRLGRITQGLLGFVLALHFLPTLHWTPDKLAVLGIGIVSGAILFTSILLLGATICFWTVETTELTNIMTYGASEMLSYPLTIYHQFLQRFFFFVVPVAFGSYVPTCDILQRALPFGLPRELAFAAPLFALLFALIASRIWGIGIRRYQSTGS